MKRPAALTVTVFFCLTAPVFAGCSQSPSEVLASIEKAAAAGDAAGFAAGFTSGSRPFAEALLLIQKDVRRGESARAPLENIFHSNVISETISGDRAVVRISGPSGPSRVVFARERGEWKLDVAATELERTANVDDGATE